MNEIVFSRNCVLKNLSDFAPNRAFIKFAKNNGQKSFLVAGFFLLSLMHAVIEL